MIYRLFYANQLIEEHPIKSVRDYRLFVDLASLQKNPEIYNGGYVFLRGVGWYQNDSAWYRCDMTPVLLEDVPKQLLLLNLILG